MKFAMNIYVLFSDNAKPSVRVGRKAAGLAGEGPCVSKIRHHSFVRQPGCRSE